MKQQHRCEFGEYDRFENVTVDCGDSAAWLVEPCGTDKEIWACEKHARDALVYEDARVTDGHGEEAFFDREDWALRVPA